MAEPDGGTEDSRVCHSYTAARKMPHVIGVWGGWVSPYPVTPTQLGAAIGTVVVLLVTRRLWGLVVPDGALQVVVILAAPIGAAWAARHLRIDGRSPMQALAGAINFATRARRGVVNGRPVRQPRPVQLQPIRIYVRERR